MSGFEQYNTIICTTRCEPTVRQPCMHVSLTLTAALQGKCPCVILVLEPGELRSKGQW